MHGFSTAGHFADYSVSDYRNAMVLPIGMDMISAAPLFCAGVTGVCDLVVDYFIVLAEIITSLPCRRPMRVEEISMARSSWMWGFGASR